MGSSVIGVIAVTAIGIICAVVLVAASKFMAVKIDERIPLVRECLPGANCGACGFAGCNGYAEALVNDEDLECSLCTPGGADVAAQVSKVLGREAGEVIPQVAVVTCMGDCNMTGIQMDYKGIGTCTAAMILFGGFGKCAFGCLGLGECLSVCPEGAICIENNIAHVDPRKCIGCGLCAKACPKHLIQVRPIADRVSVLCSNREKGANVRKKCSVGCIGCGMCMRNCPHDAIKVVNNLAEIDYTKCTSCGNCKSVCPANCLA